MCHYKQVECQPEQELSQKQYMKVKKEFFLRPVNIFDPFMIN